MTTIHELRFSVALKAMTFGLCLSFFILTVGGLSAFASEGEEVLVRIGTSKLSDDRAPEQYCEEHGLFEKYAAKFGYKIKVERPLFLSGRAILEAIHAGSLELGMCGQAPALSIIASGSPVYMTGGNVTVGHPGHWLVVRPNGPIGTLDDLVKKKASIGAPFGTTAHMFLDFLFYAAYGKSMKEMGVTIVEMNAAEAVTFPKGVDGIAFWASTPQRLVASGLGEILVDERGNAGPAWKGAVKEGKVSFFNNALFYPEGFQSTRDFGLVNRKFGDKYPKLVIAHQLAILEAMKALDQSTERGRQLALKYSRHWQVPDNIILEVFEMGLGFKGKRSWNWVVEGDVKAIVWSAPWMHGVGAIKKLITWDDAKEYFKWGSRIEKEAWQIADKYPGMSEFTRTDIPPNRGYPSWMMDKWSCAAPPKMGD